MKPHNHIFILSNAKNYQICIINLFFELMNTKLPRTYFFHIIQIPNFYFIIIFINKHLRPTIKNFTFIISSLLITLIQVSKTFNTLPSQCIHNLE